jgi:dihydrodipicolinate synthase/N-acetylneuraminate lyase
MLSAADLRGLYAIIPTPARPGAEAYDATDTIDLAETERLINALIADGASGLIVLGTTGECATVSSADYQSFVDCVCGTVRRRVPVFVGATALGGHEVVRRLRFAQERGADGTLLGMPMWQPLTLPMAVDYYAQIAALFPDLAIMVYANARAFRFAFPVEFWTEVARRAPTVIAAKSSHPRGLAEMIAGTGGRINFLPIDMAVADFYAISPKTTTACWATAAGMGPEPAVAVIEAALRADEARLAALHADIAWANEPLLDILRNPELFASYNIQVEKARMQAAGYCNPGRVRPPYNHLPEEIATPSRLCGERWAQLRRRLAEAA